MSNKETRDARGWSATVLCGRPIRKRSQDSPEGSQLTTLDSAARSSKPTRKTSTAIVFVYREFSDVCIGTRSGIDATLRIAMSCRSKSIFRRKTCAWKQTIGKKRERNGKRIKWVSGHQFTASYHRLRYYTSTTVQLPLFIASPCKTPSPLFSFLLADGFVTLLSIVRSGITSRNSATPSHPGR